MRERLLEVCKDMPEDEMAEIIDFAEYLLQKSNSLQEIEKEREKEKMNRFKSLIKETEVNFKKIIRQVREDEEIKKINSFFYFKEKGNQGVVDDLLSDFRDAIGILEKRRILQ